MANTKSNVMTGVATLAFREPNDALAEWSTAYYQTGTHSARLYKSGTGAAGSTSIEGNITPSVTQTIATLDADVTDYSYYYWNGALNVVGNFQQFELRFNDPNSEGWAEVTVAEFQGHTALATWTQETLDDADVIGFGGIDENQLSFFDWSLGSTLATVTTDIDLTTVGSCADWQLERVRVELWESDPERTTYIDQIELNGTTYTVEPGGTLPGMRLNAPFTDCGYTEDGVTIEYSADTADIDVEEETFSIDRVITKETATVTANLAESSLENMDIAMAGAVLSGTNLTLGSGVMKTLNLRIEGTAPSGYRRTIYIPSCTATGSVGQSYKKGEKTIIPVSFQALKGTEAAIRWVDNAA